MKTKEEILDFLEKNNCNQELINDVKGFYGYYWIAKSYKKHGAEFTELALQQKQAKDGEDVYHIALSYKDFGTKFTKLALQHKKAKDANYAFWIAKSYKDFGVKFTKLALQHEKAKSGLGAYSIAKKMFNESKKD